jgi:hypothetical protein
MTPAHASALNHAGPRVGLGSFSISAGSELGQRDVQVTVEIGRNRTLGALAAEGCVTHQFNLDQPW